MSIHLTTSSEVVLDSMCTVPILFCDVSGNVTTEYITCQIMKSLSYVYLVLGMNWLKSTNLVVDWGAYSLELTMGAKLHTGYLLCL